jgi:hypothetical protein
MQLLHGEDKEEVVCLEEWNPTLDCMEREKEDRIFAELQIKSDYMVGTIPFSHQSFNMQTKY